MADATWRHLFGGGGEKGGDREAMSSACPALRNAWGPTGGVGSADVTCGVPGHRAPACMPLPECVRPAGGMAEGAQAHPVPSGAMEATTQAAPGGG